MKRLYKGDLRDVCPRKRPKNLGVALIYFGGVVVSRHKNYDSAVGYVARQYALYELEDYRLHEIGADCMPIRIPLDHEKFLAAVLAKKQAAAEAGYQAKVRASKARAEKQREMKKAVK